MGDQLQISAFGDKDFSDAFDTSASGELAGAYRSAKTWCDSGKDWNADFIQKSFTKALRQDRLAQKIINIPVFDSLANWRDVGQSQAAENETRFKVDMVFQQALKHARTFGLAVVFPLLQYTDTKRNVSPRVPLDRLLASGRPVEVVGLALFHKKLKRSKELVDDICSEHYDESITVKCGEQEIHHSRCAVVGSEQYPFFESICGYLADYHELFRRLQIAIRRNSSFILNTDFQKIQTFLDAQMKAGITGTAQTRLEEIAEVRARSLYKNLNDSNVAVIDNGEGVQNFEANNIDDLVKACEQQMYVLAGVSDIPVSRLFSLHSGGLAGTAIQSMEDYSQALDSLRVETVEKPLDQIDRILARVGNYEFPRSQWSWNDTKAEEMLLRLRSSTSTVDPSAVAPAPE